MRTRVRRAFTVVAAASTLLALVAAPAAAAGDTEAEAFTINSAYGSAYTDATASGGHALAIWNTATATGTVATAQASYRLHVYAQGQSCGGAAPIMSVAVDGVSAGTTSVTTAPGGWGDYVFSGSWGAGNHTVAIGFTNEFGNGTCDRWLGVDRIGFDAGFITRSGRNLMLGGKVFKFAGLNAFGMSGCEGPNSQWTDAQLDDYFGRLAPNSVTRTWAFDLYGIAPLDRIVASAARHQQRVLFTLGDGRSHCGEYDGTVGGEGTDKTLAWYNGGWRTNYLPWVRQVVGHFKNETAVAFWELLNEPGSMSNPAYTDAIVKAFFDGAAAEIKAIDPNHLVSTGTLSEDMYGTHNYATVSSGPNIDLSSLHEYEYDWNNSNAIVSGHLAPELTMMASINKPLFVGETGVFAAPSGCRTTLTGRATVVRQKLDQYLAKTGVSGVLVWSIMQKDPVQFEPCPYEGLPTDPMIPVVKAKQNALNG